MYIYIYITCFKWESSPLILLQGLQGEFWKTAPTVGISPNWIYIEICLIRSPVGFHNWCSVAGFPAQGWRPFRFDVRRRNAEIRRFWVVGWSSQYKGEGFRQKWSLFFFKPPSKLAFQAGLRKHVYLGQEICEKSPWVLILFILCRYTTLKEEIFPFFSLNYHHVRGFYFEFSVEV